MSDKERDELDVMIDHRFEQRLGSALTKFVRWIIGFTVGSAVTIFAAGMWANSMFHEMKKQSDQIAQLIAENSAQDAATQQRLHEWTTWRGALEDRMRDRFTGTNWDTAASIYNMQSPATPMPYLFQIKKVSP